MLNNYAISTDVLSLPETYQTRTGYTFCPLEDMWEIADVSHRRYFNFKSLEPYCTDELIYSFKKALLWFLREKSASHSHNMFNQFKRMAVETAGQSKLSHISGNHIISYTGNLPKQIKWYMGALSGFLKKWHQLGYPGIDPDAYAVLGELRIKGNQKGAAVLTQDPVKGPFDEIELHAIHRAFNTAYAEGKISNREFSLIWLFMAIGARPVQVAALKVKDVIGLREVNGKNEYIINIPRAKQRQALLRKSFKSRLLLPAIGEVLDAWIAQIKHIHATEIRDEVSSDELPLFPVWNGDNAPGFEHHPEGTALNKEIQTVFSTLYVQSHRTGEQMYIKPQRFRYTLGTRAAMEKNSVLVIAEILDQSDTQNAYVYVKCVPEIIHELDKALAMEMAPFAAAFAGKIVVNDKDAKRSDDPSSLIRYPKRKPGTDGIGRCGGCGDCNGMVPVACYVCRNFQAWLDAPHEEVLNDLLAERQKILEETGDERIAFANDNVIFAISQVVQQCSDMREAANG